MFKKVLSVSLVLFGIVFFQTVEECFANAAVDLEQADAYVKNGQYDQAETTYKAIVANYPGTDNDLQARRKLVALYMHEQTVAKTAFQDLTTKFSTHPDMPETVYKIAEHYRYTVSHEKYKMTELFYEYFVDRWPKHELAMWAQAGLAASHVRLGDTSAARSAADKLVVDYSDRAEVEKAVYDVAHQFNQLGNYTEAKQLYQHVISMRPEAKRAMWEQIEMAHSNIALSGEVAAEAAIDVLKANLSNHDYIATALFDIAEHYGRTNQYEKARQLYQYVAGNCDRENIRSMWSQMRVVMSYISLDDVAGAQTAMNDLLANFSGKERIADAVCAIANHYKDLGKLEKARQYYQYILDTWPKHEHYGIWGQIDLASVIIASGDHAGAEAILDGLVTKLDTGFDAYTHWPAVAGEAYFFVGGWYEQLGRYTKAVQCYRKVADDYPDHRRAWNALYLIGRNVEILKKSGLLQESEADLVIVATYKQLLEKYPDCSAATYVRRWLADYSSK